MITTIRKPDPFACDLCPVRSITVGGVYARGKYLAKLCRGCWGKLKPTKDR